MDIPDDDMQAPWKFQALERAQAEIAALKKENEKLDDIKERQDEDIRELRKALESWRSAMQR